MWRWGDQQSAASGGQVGALYLVDRGYGAVVQDFLTIERRPNMERIGIITNPPYRTPSDRNIAEKFIRKAFDLGCTHVAMLLKSNFWHAKRGGLFEQFRPSHIHPLRWRPDFTGARSPFLDVAWSVWRPGTTATAFSVLHRPGEVG